MDDIPGLRALNSISSNITRPERLMNPATAAGSLQGPNPLFAILCAGLACGVLDITAALVVYGHYGRPPMRLLQGIAAGLLGPRSFEGGIATALLGLFCQFVIAVYFFMNRVAVPLSGAIKFPFSVKMMAIGIVIHIFCVGLPIAIIVRRFSMN